MASAPVSKFRGPLANVGPSPRADLTLCQMGLRTPQITKNILNHFGEAATEQMCLQLAALGLDGDLHDEEASELVLEWLSTSDFSNYELLKDGCVRLFRKYVKGAIRRMALGYWREHKRGMLPKTVKRHMTTAYLGVCRECAFRQTPELTGEESDRADREGLKQYLAHRATGRETRVVKAIGRLASVPDLDLDQVRMNEVIAEMTGMSVPNVHAVRSKLRKGVKRMRRVLVKQMLEYNMSEAESE